jgi:hypothetical protein
MAKLRVERRQGEMLMKAVYKPAGGEPLELQMSQSQLKTFLEKRHLADVDTFYADLRAQDWAEIDLPDTHHNLIAL